MLCQISWIEKYLNGEKIFGSPPNKKVKPKEVTPEIKAKFEAEILAITKKKMGAKAIVRAV